MKRTNRELRSAVRKKHKQLAKLGLARRPLTKKNKGTVEP